MANISKAIGTIEFKSKNKDVLEILFHSLSKMNGEYSTDLLEDFDNSKIEINEDEYIFKSSFYGSGRWTYLNNISYYPYWVKLNEDDMNKMKDNDWKMVYDFSDEECGNCVLYHALIKINHSANTEIKEADIEQVIEDYEHSWVNIVKLGFYESIYDYVENNYFIEDTSDAEYFLEDFDENKNELANYFNCDRNDLELLLNKSNLLDTFEKAKTLLEANN